MFSETPPGVLQPAYYAVLKTSKTTIIQDDEHDLFGDGSVIIKSAPGHTPGRVRSFGFSTTPLATAG